MTSNTIRSDLLDIEKGFASMDLDPRLLRSIAKMGFNHPTIVQSSAIPLALAGKDILARARTGSGKTAAYCLPVVQKILLGSESRDASDSQHTVKAIILVPTKELSEQVHRHIKDLTIYCSQEVVSVNFSAGEANVQTQKALLANNPNIIVSTPSRLLTLLESKDLNLRDSLESLVIDEADLILSYGYDEDLRKILTHLPKIYQSYLMSATLSDDVDELKQLVLRNPAILKLEESDDQDLLTQYYVKCTEKEKFLLTYFILKLRVHPFGTGKSIIFVNDIDRGYRLKLFLQQFGISSCTLNSELPLKSRYHIVQEFNRGAYDFIIATDEVELLKGEAAESDDEAGEPQEEDNDGEGVQDGSEKTGQKRAGGDSGKGKNKRRKDAEYGVSRGIDFQNVQSVVNFDMPRTSKSYMHRVGRTARGVGNQGWALSFVVPDGTPTDAVLSRKLQGKKKLTDEQILKRIEKKQTDLGRSFSAFNFDMSQVDGFRYRVDDGLRMVTRVAIKEARTKELKQEILNSEKLKAHFEDNPKDLQALRHDQLLHPTKVQAHMKHIPDYLMPKKVVGVSAGRRKEVGSVPFNMPNRRKRGEPYRGGRGKKPVGSRSGHGVSGKKKDPLKTFKK
ncbi:P-loop containing nucleoside triphosphate hydrolase protein [Polychytrium aggregatum]|uniref:P-loop containing nucleoside triphosphate hydrolase protein n=1 Tax=Polychytrium aggregatum TaxID=110093 RepID=UPI0022FDBB09|nr:P-loop containing nucleoside triphosphate hydrolase protein [Polychytrium aggregatum]KAI9199344.1 P-loop containing nucleoside triphosphate hydrolase protein [Polychytrium aggregatum]